MPIFGSKGKAGTPGQGAARPNDKDRPGETELPPFSYPKKWEAVRKLRNRSLATTVFARLGKEQPMKPYFSPMLSMMVSTRPSMLFSVVRYGAMRSV